MSDSAEMPAREFKERCKATMDSIAFLAPILAAVRQDERAKLPWWRRFFVPKDTQCPRALAIVENFLAQVDGFYGTVIVNTWILAAFDAWDRIAAEVREPFKGAPYR